MSVFTQMLEIMKEDLLVVQRNFKSLKAENAKLREKVEALEKENALLKMYPNTSTCK